MSTLRTLEYAQVDVFAERVLEGNQLGIFTDATGLTPSEMQALARETNFAETTFILPRDPALERERGVQVRIFTTEEELPFAGHPTLGTASWLHLHHPVLRGAERITLDLAGGQIPVHFRSPLQADAGVYGTMRQKDPVFGEDHDPAAVAAVLGLKPDDLDLANPIQTVSTGMAFCIVPLRSLDVSRRLRIPQAQAQAYLANTDAKFFFCVAAAAKDSAADWHNRMQFYSGEDPATGSASGAAIAYLVRHGLVPSGQPTSFEQGIEIRRPSRIDVSAVSQNGIVREVLVGGRTIEVARGRYFLPRYTAFPQQ